MHLFHPFRVYFQVGDEDDDESDFDPEEISLDFDPFLNETPLFTDDTVPGNLQSYWTTMKLWELTVVLDH